MESAPPDTTAALTDPARLRALRRSGLLDPSADAVFDRYTRMASRLLGTPVALLSLMEDNRQTTLSVHGADLKEAPLSHSFCQHVVAGDAPLLISHTPTHPLGKINGAVADFGAMAYAGAPVRAPGGEPLGSFCVVSDTPRVWTDGDVQVIEELAAAISNEIALRMTERRATALVEVAALGMLMADDEGAVFEVSPSWKHFTGFTSARSVDDGWMNALHSGDRVRVARAWYSAVGKRSSCTLDCRVMDGSGTAHAVRLHGAPIWAETHTFTEYVGAFTALG